MLGTVTVAAEKSLEETSIADRFQQAESLEWRTTFSPRGTDDWQKHWTLDGEKAQITHSEKGMDFFAGNEFGNDAHHAVLWTRESYAGDIRIDYEYTKLDESIRAVTILYIQASGEGEGAYSTDISTWADRRKIPAMRRYFNHMNTYHISYAAFGMKNEDPEADYIRLRRYTPLRGKGINDTELMPDYLRTGLFKTGVPYKITLIKRGQDLFMRVRGDDREQLCHWQNESLPPITEGRIGLRHMYTRAARYKNFRIAVPAVVQSSDRSSDVKKVQGRLLQELLLSDPVSQESRDLHTVLNASVQAYVTKMTLEGAWSDIDYTNQDKAMWESAWHTKRLLEMARVYASSDLPLSGSHRLLERIRRGLTFWLVEETRARGWYHQQLFVPHNLGQVCLLLGEKVPRAQRDAIVKRLRQRSSFSGRQSLRTGSNLLTFARNNVLLGCLENSAEDIAQAFEYAAKELKVTTQDGIQSDQSYHQHGACLHMTTYGTSYSINFARLAWLGQGTAFAFPEDKLTILFDFILDGQRWFVRGAEFDYLTAGRALAREHTVGPTRMLPQWRFMAEIPGARHQERRDFFAEMKGELPPVESELVGNRFFWRSAMMVHRRQGYYASVRMLADNIASTDKVNYENLFGHHLSDGAMCLMRSGNEYAGIYPLWNWRCLPGTTVEDGNPPLEWKNLRTQGVRPFVGGVSDGDYGLAAMDFARGPLTGERLRYHRAHRINAAAVTLTARKAWFFFDREMVCLGAGITGKTGRPVSTTLNQCRLNGKVTASEGVQLGAEGAVFSGPAWIHHDGIGYLLSEGGRANLETKEKTGSWESINQSRPGTTITEPVFNLWLDHGKKPREERYVYHILPDVDAADMAPLSQQRDIEVLSNSSELQAVRHKRLGITAAAFYSPGKLEVASEADLAVDSSCILLVRELPNNRLRLALSKPDASAAVPTAVTVSIGDRQIVFSPPTGPDRGKSVVREISVVTQRGN